MHMMTSTLSSRSRLGTAPQLIRSISASRTRCRLPSVRVPSRTNTGSKHVLRKRGKFVVVSASSDQPSGNDKEENPILQELLVDMLKIETGKEEVNKYVEQESDNLRNIVEDVRSAGLNGACCFNSVHMPDSQGALSGTWRTLTTLTASNPNRTPPLEQYRSWLTL
eukprot:357413-Prorocentrum_minimum.AAC.4